jgi:hypothetical protein
VVIIMTTIPEHTITDSLRPLGFTDHEARAYVTLLRDGPLSGYQLAKASRIPRPNIYPVLDKLEGRGVVVRVERKGSVLYGALPAESMLSRLSRGIQTDLARARHELGAVEARQVVEHVWNVQGYEAMLARAEELIDGCEEQVLLGLWSEESLRLSAAVARAQERGAAVSTLCIQGCPEECGGCRGHIYRYPVAAGSKTRWLVIVADEKKLLAGQVSPDGRSSAATTTLEVFSRMAAQYVRNAIAAAEIVRSLGPALPDLLDDRARDAVQGVGLLAGDTTWLDDMMRVVRGTSS